MLSCAEIIEQQRDSLSLLRQAIKAMQPQQNLSLISTQPHSQSQHAFSPPFSPAQLLDDLYTSSLNQTEPTSQPFSSQPFSTQVNPAHHLTDPVSTAINPAKLNSQPLPPSAHHLTDQLPSLTKHHSQQCFSPSNPAQHVTELHRPPLNMTKPHAQPFSPMAQQYSQPQQQPWQPSALQSQQPSKQDDSQLAILHQISTPDLTLLDEFNLDQQPSDSDYHTNTEWCTDFEQQLPLNQATCRSRQ